MSMTPARDQPLAPLTNLPPPPQLPPEDPSLVLPAEIIAESRRTIARGLRRIAWAAALILIALWYVLLVLYVAGGSPTYWGLGALASLAEPTLLRTIMYQLGFTSSGLWMAFLLLPVGATVLSLLLLPLATAAIAGMNPRRHLSEAGFQREVATRITAVLMIPPLLTVAALPITVLLGVPQPWSGIGAGPLTALALAGGAPRLTSDAARVLAHRPPARSGIAAGPPTALALAVVALLLTWVSIPGWVTAPRVLGIQSAAALETTARLDRDLDKRHAAALKVLAQDRRHLPPTPGTPQAAGALTPRGATTALALILRSSLTWVVPALMGLAWIVFGITDIVVTFSGISDLELNPGPSPLRWQALAAGLPLLGLSLLAIAMTPALARLLSNGMRSQVTDQRTYPSWAHRARVNPWEQRVVTLTGWLNALIVLGATVVLGLALVLLDAVNGLAWVWMTLNVLVIAPLLGLAAAAAMRTGLRDVLYGPAGRYMRRDTEFALVAPDIGTRTERAEDPAVRAEMRRRLQEQDGDHSLEIFDLDTAGDRLWVDDSMPGARETQIRAVDIARGQLPDFGADDSPFAAPAHAGARRERHEAPSRQHDIPGSVADLREG